MVKVGTDRRRLAVVMRGMMGGGFSEAAADCAVTAWVSAVVRGTANADWIIFLRCLELDDSDDENDE
eukprot:CAMPEP_0183738800 /NCGR_PEP_ID=MMETSP0737-20130205/55520_1 /TAXON_ID=385413 /ORGANISM="Thalassiosira miniscula, Strain CCMP1093" /LENGTH=66 /DNA_ID=CAMNT_0025973431 /DNA_START=51 /DNA_END=248 /DNA_ORIENTATION=+